MSFPLPTSRPKTDWITTEREGEYKTGTNDVTEKKHNSNVNVNSNVNSNSNVIV